MEPVHNGGATGTGGGDREFSAGLAGRYPAPAAATTLGRPAAAEWPEGVGGSVTTDSIYERANSTVTELAASATTESWLQRARSSVTMEDPSMLRGVEAASVLRSFARVLSSESGPTDYYEMSAIVDSIDTFVSHTWSTPRWKKFLVLVFHFNLLAALLISFAVAACACALTARGLLPATVGTAYIWRDGFQFTQGVLCMPLGLAAFVTSLLTLHELDRFFVSAKRHIIFLDKVCVHQRDSELKRMGIEHLAAFIYHSRNILVVYSDAYLQRLWTIYEVASWLMLHKGEKVIARPLSAPVLLLCGCALFAALDVALLLVQVTDLGAKMRPVPGFFAVVLVLFPTFTMAAFLVARWAVDRDRIKNHATTFSLAEAQCSDENDRYLVQQNIVALMKHSKFCEPDAANAQVFQAFEELVRTNVPKLIESSFGRCGLQYSWGVVSGLPRALTTFDVLAGAIAECQSLRYILLMSLFNIVLALMIGPLILALILALTRRPGARTLCGCLSIAVLATVVLSSYCMLLDQLNKKAEHSNGWLALALPTYLSVAAATAVVYRPMLSAGRSGDDAVLTSGSRRNSG